MYINPVFIFVSDLVVASPVEDYFLYIDDMTHPDKVKFHYSALLLYLKNRSFTFCYLQWQEEAEKITQPILDALGEDYSICCQGTDFTAVCLLTYADKSLLSLHTISIVQLSSLSFIFPFLLLSCFIIT